MATDNLCIEVLPGGYFCSRPDLVGCTDDEVEAFKRDEVPEHRASVIRDTMWSACLKLERIEAAGVC